MNQKKLKKQSKYLSLILRHKPEAASITLSKDGWANVNDLLTATNMTRAELEYIVANNDKKRFSFNEDGTLIRANQGHSVNVQLDFDTFIPTTELYHGTSKHCLDRIYKEGLKKMDRTHVHLSRDTQTAEKVGNRKGHCVILAVDAQSMYNDGHRFFISDNGVVLIDHVPVKYLRNIY